MTNFTEKQNLFIAAKRDGLSNRAAAIYAGYSYSCADQRASTLMRNPAVSMAIGSCSIATPAKAVLDALLAVHHDDAVSFLMDCMNDPNLSFSFRFEAAKALLPYQHARRAN